MTIAQDTNNKRLAGYGGSRGIATSNAELNAPRGLLPTRIGGSPFSQMVFRQP